MIKLRKSHRKHDEEKMNGGRELYEPFVYEKG